MSQVFCCSTGEVVPAAAHLSPSAGLMGKAGSICSVLLETGLLVSCCKKPHIGETQVGGRAGRRAVEADPTPFEVLKASA